MEESGHQAIRADNTKTTLKKSEKFPFPLLCFSLNRYVWPLEE